MHEVACRFSAALVKMLNRGYSANDLTEVASDGAVAATDDEEATDDAEATDEAVAADVGIATRRAPTAYLPIYLGSFTLLLIATYL